MEEPAERVGKTPGRGCITHIEYASPKGDYSLVGWNLPSPTRRANDGDTSSALKISPPKSFAR